MRISDWSSDVCSSDLHVRYPTAGSSTSAEAQPFYTNTPYGISLSHNGNLTNSEELKQELFLEDRRHLNTESDSEVLLNVFAHELLQRGVLRLTPDDIFAAVSGVHMRCRGAYACRSEEHTSELQSLISTS